MSFAQMQEFAKDAAAVLGSVSVLATFLAHTLPWKPTAAFFARLGLATSKFKVESK